MPGDGLGRIHGVEVRLLGDARGQGLDAVVAQGVIAEERVLLLVGEHFLVAEIVEELDQALAGLTRLFQEGHGGLVGGRFLDPRIAQDRELGEVGR